MSRPASIPVTHAFHYIVDEEGGDCDGFYEGWVENGDYFLFNPPFYVKDIKIIMTSEEHKETGE